jgi:hypothetical protein
MEEFRDIPGYEGLYQVSNLGNVKSLGNDRTRKEKILKLCINKTGYYHVGLSKHGKVKSLNVHQLVVMAFLGHDPCGYNLVVDHINNNPLDNRVDNLQIVTQRFNSKKNQVKYSSKHKGVSWYKKLNKWVSHIRINGKGFHLGYFNCELAASIAYQNKLKEILC